MKIQVIQIPYDSGHKNRRQGLGPGQFIKQDIHRMLHALGHDVLVGRIESESDFTTEVMTAFELNRLLAEEVHAAFNNNRFPLVLAGNCNSCLGTISGVRSQVQAPGVIWFDAHGEFNTPETTLSGFLDGMPLAMASGRCWQAILKTIPGFAPVEEPNVILVGAQDLDREEQKNLEQSKINLIRSRGSCKKDILEKLNGCLRALQRRTNGVYLHIDMDAFEVKSGAANHFGISGGLKPALIQEAITMIREHVDILACGLASYDPVYDKDERVLDTGFQIIKHIFSIL